MSVNCVQSGENGRVATLVRFTQNGRGLSARHDDGRIIVVNEKSKATVRANIWTPVNLVLSSKETCWIATPIVMAKITDEADRLNRLIESIGDKARDLEQREAALKQAEQDFKKTQREKTLALAKVMNQQVQDTQRKIRELKKASETEKIEQEFEQLENFRQRLEEAQSELDLATLEVCEIQDSLEARGGFCELEVPNIPTVPSPLLNFGKTPPANGKSQTLASNGRKKRYHIAV